MDSGDDSSSLGYVIAGLGPITAGAALTSVRGDVDNANLALVLVLVVVTAGAIGGRGPGLFAAVVTALSYDFFLTKPYLSIHIESTDDIETTIILLVIGLVVGQIGVVARRRRMAAQRGSDEIARLHRVAERAATGVSVDELTVDVCDEVKDLLGLESCTFERAPFGFPLARLERGGAITGSSEHRFVAGAFALPREGVEIPVLGRGAQVGRLVLEPGELPTRGVTVEQRIVAIALSDQLGAAMAPVDGNRSASE
jgi:hypothetical protein